MDASSRKSLCLLGSVLTVLFLAWTCGADGATTVIFDPFIAVRGHTLEVNVFSTSSDECTLDLSESDVSPLASGDAPLTWSFKDALSVRVLVALDAKEVKANVSCSADWTSYPAQVSSDVDVQFSWTASPSPADEGRPLTANVTLLNQGGHSAVDLECTATADGLLKSLACPESETSTCQVGPLFPHLPKHLLLHFESIAADTNVTLSCTARNVPELIPSTFQILLKGDAAIHIVPQNLPTDRKAIAGSDFTVVTTIENTGRAKADDLVCNLTIVEPEKTVVASISDSQSKCVAVVNSTTNATIGAVCTFGDFQPDDHSNVSLSFRVDPAVESDSKARFEWACQATGLSKLEHSVEVGTAVQANLDIVLPANSSIADGSQALLFHMQNDGPSYVRDGECNFTFPTGVAPKFWSTSAHFRCEKTNNDTEIHCNVTEIPPTSAEFNLEVLLTDRTLKHFVINASCNTKNPASHFVGSFSVLAGVAPSPSPAPTPVAPPDNTMMVIVTVIVAIGLLIVITIWWRKKQDRSGWEATGPSPRSPSLNRFSDVELSVRSS